MEVIYIDFSFGKRNQTDRVRLDFLFSVFFFSLWQTMKLHPAEMHWFDIFKLLFSFLTMNGCIHEENGKLWLITYLWLWYRLERAQNWIGIEAKKTEKNELNSKSDSIQTKRIWSEKNTRESKWKFLKHFSSFFYLQQKRTKIEALEICWEMVKL